MERLENLASEVTDIIIKFNQFSTADVQHAHNWLESNYGELALIRRRLERFRRGLLATVVPCQS